MTPGTTTAAGFGRGRTDVTPAATATGPQVPVRARLAGKAPGPRTLWLLAAVVVLFSVCAVSLAVGARGLSLGPLGLGVTELKPGDGEPAGGQGDGAVLPFSEVDASRARRSCG